MQNFKLAYQIYLASSYLTFNIYSFDMTPYLFEKITTVHIGKRQYGRDILVNKESVGEMNHGNVIS